jgi:CubicO group peptidase (beta-lactamase class C family)
MPFAYYTMRIILVIVVFSLSSCWMLRAYKIRHMQLTDYRKLSSVPISKSSTPFYFHTATNSQPYQQLKDSIDCLITNTETAAFLVVRNNTLIYENYLMGFDKHSLLPANSMAKSFTGTLVGIALDERKIRSLSDPITNYLPELKKRDARFSMITISHLLDMRSGLDFNEGSYDLRDDAVKLGFRPNLVKHLLKVSIAREPGKFKYQSVNTQLLGLIIERATGMRLQDYLQEKLWNRIGAESAATWNVDSKKHKHVLTSAGINATAHDFAKLGRLYLNKGCWNGKHVISASWINNVTSLDTIDKYEGYKNQWWNRKLSTSFDDSIKAQSSLKARQFSTLHEIKNGYRLSYRTEAFSAIGFRNQIIYVHPKKQVIIVRLGRAWPKRRQFVQSIFNLGEEL